MAQEKSWLSEIIEVLNELGGEGTLQDIYMRLEERKHMDFTKTWRNTVRRTIYDNSSDSDGYKGRDVFYSVSGKGEGIWGLNEYEPSVDNVDLSEDDTGFQEGKKKARIHISRERNPKVIRKAKKIFSDKHSGQLFCEICGFNFHAFYGEIGEGFIEGHHTVALSELDEDTITKAEDISIVCSNCHRMLHRKRPWLGKDDLKDLVRK
ncbi:putative restriction endonuclease [Alkaliphilus metalliredigens QYMF]|uniref:Putative restriction endonuclease n=1 Tax=Alkaliphilus metalliredigens (strain QYMF) TaxID=293826 RepID=A6TW04_ALKMQ|nr:HNH endonuclease [Alkaliphilus metalliredigens]ABR50372.1 putative restriction endonuclease [Alkaliphilus metalliredigens QYMF]